MANVLQELLAAGLIDKLEGNDERFKKITQAADSLAKTFKSNPALLIPAILTVLAGDVATDDPLIGMAESALLAEWESMQSVHTDKPVHIYRALLLAACATVAQERNAAILWLTAADMLRFSNLGREEPVVVKLITQFGDAAEQQEIALFSPQARTARKSTDLPKLELKEVVIEEIDRVALYGEIGAASAQHNTKNVHFIQGVTHNRYWPNSPQHWAEDFANSMKDVLGKRFDELGDVFASEINGMNEAIEKAFKAQTQGLQTAITQAQSATTREQVRLDSLWWYESLYSTSAKMSYREIDPLAAAILMPLDLIAIMPLVTPTSVAYLLAEAVARLPNAGFENSVSLKEILERTSALRHTIPQDVMDAFRLPRREGRLSLRDILRLALEDTAASASDLLELSSIAEDATISLPLLSRILLRQEQAVRLSEPSK